jgi:putative sigma-54 modulation protein
MRYEFTGRHITVTPALESHAREHLDKLDKILDSAPMRAHVILEVEKHRQMAEILVSWRDHTFTSNAVTKDMYDSITQAAEKIEKQLFKLKDRFASGKRQNLSTVEAAAANQPEEERAAPPAGEPRIVRTRLSKAKPMTPEEAAGQITDSGDQVLVFRNAESGRVGVVYKRRDGNFGLIEP